jgi:hypothetical protein
VFQKVKDYEYQNGRLNIQKRKSFGLVDFTSEGASDETRFIIMTDSLPDLLRNICLDDYIGIEPFVYIYVLGNGEVREELQLEKINRLVKNLVQDYDFATDLNWCRLKFFVILKEKLSNGKMLKVVFDKWLVSVIHQKCFMN